MTKVVLFLLNVPRDLWDEAWMYADALQLQ